METATLSTKGQLVIPTRFRKALHLQPGDKLQIDLEGDLLTLKRADRAPARLIKGKNGRLVLVAPPGAPAMTVDIVKSLLAEHP